MSSGSDRARDPFVRRASALVVQAIVACVALACLWAACPTPAWADDARPSVLLVEAGLGDYDLCALHWLGEQTEVVDEAEGFSLVRAAAPAWWAAGGGAGDAPATFLLGSADGAVGVTPERIAWALDAIRGSGAQPKTFIVGMGPAGLAARAYAEDLAEPKQSSRADVVGLCLCGTPNSGYSMMATYPELGIWDALAQTAGVDRSGLAPQSDYLVQLDGGALPQVAKTLTVSGSVGDLGFGATDGVAVAQDFPLGSGVTDQLANVHVSASIGQNINLTGVWSPFTSGLDYGDRVVDAHLTERLSAMSGYETTAEVQVQVREFYDTWFAGGAPVTHISTVLALDLSGSMWGQIDDANTKLSAAQKAAGEYLNAVRAYEGMPNAAPADLSVIGFNETLSDIARGFDEAALQAIGAMDARGETNIGIALDEAVARLEAAPLCANKRILLLSDGARTEGATDDEMLAGVVARAHDLGIVIDAVGFGDIGESNAGFLEAVAAATGGAYYWVADMYHLEVNFVKSHFASLGLELVDEELAAGAAREAAVGVADAATVALGVGVVANGFTPSLRLLCDGVEVDPALCTVSSYAGFASLQLFDPPAGAYTVEVTGGDGDAHVFAVTQEGIAEAPVIATQQVDNSMLMLVAVGIAALVSIVSVTAFTRARRKAA